MLMELCAAAGMEELGEWAQGWSENHMHHVIKRVMHENVKYCAGECDEEGGGEGESQRLPTKI